MSKLIRIVAVGLTMLVSTASAQPPTGRQAEEARKRAENKAVLDVVGAKMRAKGQTIAQQAAQARADAEAAKRRKYKKNHKSVVVGREHPKTESKPAVKADPKK